uniref:VASt domain-containing protein n=1 Tax=Kalanchoe fedtschenkoi TaxID=63787 RepID=A0A7N0ZUW2_KALFE
MALVAPGDGDPMQVPHPQSSTMEPPRVESASELASEYSSLVGAVVPGDSSDQFSGSPNRQRELDLASAAALKSEEYRQLFRLPPGEVLVQDFNCALQENMLFQGHLYVFRNYLCFYSNIFGFETKKIIQFSEITILRRAKTAGIFPNAIEIFTGERKHFFASFLSRDEAFNLISDLWPDYENRSNENSRQQDSPSESSSLNSKPLAAVNLGSSDNGADDLDSVARIQNVSDTNDSESLPIVKDKNGPVTPSKLQKNVEEAVCVTNTGSLPSAKGIVLKQEDIEAPKVPEDFVKVAEAKFPIKVGDFFRFFFSDEGVTFLEAFRKSCGDSDFKCTEWCTSDKFGNVREMSFLHPIKFYLGAKSSICRETQKVRSYRGSHLIVETSQEVNGVPYADYFTVEGLWDVKNDESGDACFMKVYLNVAFSKKTVWKGKIVQSTTEECREAYAIWINNAHEFLKKKNLEKQDEASTYSLNEDIPDHSDLKAEIGENSRMLLQTNEHRRQPLSSSIDADKHIVSTINGNSCGSTCTVSLGGKFAKIFGIMRSQGYLPHLLVVTVAVVLLMQLTIVLLLSRSPQVQPVYQMDYFHGMNQGLHPSPQELAWLEKRVHHLKEEMLMVESRLERMRLEHKHLQSQLEDFELFRKKD